jgi:hypothetical protein
MAKLPRQGRRGHGGTHRGGRRLSSSHSDEEGIVSDRTDVSEEDGIVSDRRPIVSEAKVIVSNRIDA